MNTPRRILLIGAGGRMGQAIVRLLANGSCPGLQLAAAIDGPGCPLLGRDAGTAAGAGELGVPIRADLAAALAGHPEVAVDFSSPAATTAAASPMASAGVPWVVGTTGLDDTARAAVTSALILASISRTRPACIRSNSKSMRACPGSMFPPVTRAP